MKKSSFANYNAQWELYGYMQNVQGAIFDLDGTLLDSMWKWGEIAIDYIKSHGKTPRPGFLEVLRSFNTTQEAQYFIDEYAVNLPLEEVIYGRDKLMLDFYSNDVKLKDGVIPVLELLKNNGVKMCIATATDRWLIEPALKLHDLNKYFQCVLTCTEENTSKSNPDIFIRAAAILGSEIKNTLVVEDALYAMKTAKKAGFTVIGISDESNKDEQDEIINSCDFFCITPGDMLKFL